MGRRDAISAIFAYVILVFIFIAIFALVFGIRLVITGGDISCAFSPDPALCVAVKGVGQ